MSLSCWQALDSPSMILSSTVLEAFDGHVFKPHGILTDFPIEIGSKIVFVDVEVIDALLDYNEVCCFNYFSVLMFPPQRENSHYQPD